MSQWPFEVSGVSGIITNTARPYVEKRRKFHSGFFCAACRYEFPTHGAHDFHYNVVRRALHYACLQEAVRP